MPSAAIETILNITALSILADRKVLTEEIESFTFAAQNIPAIQKAKPRLTAIWLEGWYHRNKIRLIKTMQSKSFTQWFRESLDDVKAPEDRAAVIKTMKRVALSDSEFHANEKSLIHFIARHWNMELH